MKNLALKLQHSKVCQEITENEITSASRKGPC
jgi:hypothetical protein